MTRRSKADGGAADGFSAAERQAMRQRARELAAEQRATRSRESDAAAVREAVAAMDASDRAIGERLCALVHEVAPTLAAKLWYGMPAWTRDGKVVCFYQAASKFTSRYATLGFTDQAALDDGALWPTAFALRALGPSEEAQVRALVARAVR